MYVNDVTGERTSSHPLEAFLKYRQAEPLEATFQPDNEPYEDGKEQELAYYDEGQPLQDTADPAYQEETKGPEKSDKEAKHKAFDFHCQWSERDIFGKVTLYGLTLRVLGARTCIKFDGMDGQWEYIALKGPFGSLELHDLFIGAKVSVFGRHLTISSANLAACEWIDKERRRLGKQADEFRRRIESVGHVPVVRKVDVQSVKHIMRDSKTKGQVNLRNILKDNAKLGEQLASLGMANRY